MRLFTLCLLAALLASCATVPKRFLLNNDDDIAYVKTIWAEANPAIYLNGQEAELAWSRARVFVARFGAPIRRSYGYCIDTMPSQFYPANGIASLEFTVTRLNDGTNTEIFVSCFARGDTYADRLAVKAMLYYMRTGILRPYLIGKDYDIRDIIRAAQLTTP